MGLDGFVSCQDEYSLVMRDPERDLVPAMKAYGLGLLPYFPLASGLLSGKYDEHTTFAATDHRTYNRHGEAFDVGETFAACRSRWAWSPRARSPASRRRGRRQRSWRCAG